MYSAKLIEKKRCDEAMKRSKERGYMNEGGGHWHCPQDCLNCFCCLVTLDDGRECHVDLTRERKKVK